MKSTFQHIWIEIKHRPGLACASYLFTICNGIFKISWVSSMLLE